MVGWNSVHIYDIFNCYSENVNKNVKRHESEAGYAKHLNLYWPKTYIFRCRVNEHVIVLYLYNVSINKILGTEFITVKVSQNLNLSTQWSYQLSRYMFSKFVECLERNIWKQIYCERPSSTKQMNREQNIQIEIWKLNWNMQIEI